VADSLPAGVTTATWMATASSGGGMVTGPSSGTGALATTVDLPVNASVTFTFTVQIDPSATGSLTNTATVSPPSGVTDLDPANNSATDSDNLTPQADLSITKTDGALSAVPGNSTTYTIVVSNAGPSTAVDQAVTDLFPSAITAVRWTAVASPGSSVAVAGGAGNIMTTVTLLPGGTATFTAVATIDPTATGSLSNSATVAVPPGDTTPANNTATDSDSLTPQADLSITKTDGVASAVPGTNTIYTIVVSNAGPSTAVDQAVTDLFPLAISAVQWTAVASAGSSVAAASGSGNIATTVTLLPGGTVTFTAAATINPSATGTLTNTATVAVPPGDTTPANNSATDTDTLTSEADLAVTKTVDNPTPIFGTPITYTVTVSNHGPQTATDVTVADPLPAGLIPISVAPSQGSVSGGVWNVGTLANGASAVLHITAQTALNGPIVNNVVALSGQSDPALDNNQATASIKVLLSPEQISKLAFLGNTILGNPPVDPALFPLNARFVTHLYSDLLRRQPDALGQAAWSNALDNGRCSRFQVILAFENSAEYLGNEVDAVYGQLLNRAADPGGRSTFINFLQTGGTFEQLQAIIAGSEEYFQRAGNPSAAFLKAGSTNAAFLSALYQDSLGRPLDPGGMAAWGQALASGLTRTQVADAIFTSTEYTTALVNSYYTSLLHRPADQAGVNAWVALLQHGSSDEQVIAAILASDEYFRMS
jgi:uncharacterized repeat protein (TIGR01451 family)